MNEDEEMIRTNRKIYQSLSIRNRQEKNVNLERIIQANDQLINLVTNLKTEIDHLSGQVKMMQDRKKLDERSLQELRILVKEKDTMIHKLLQSR